MLRIGVLASHGGSNLQAVLDAVASGRLDGDVAVVISNNRDSGALQRAQDAGVPWRHLSGKTHPSPEDLDEAILATLSGHGADVVLLAGYMKKLGPRTLRGFGGRILNVHPALLPRHGGRGMFGMAVHEAVLAAGDEVTGATVHVVEEEYDTGPALAQREVPVLPGDTPEALRERVLAVEHALVVDVLQGIARGEIDLSTS